MAELADWTLDSERFVTLLGKLVGEAESLQNQPPRYVPREDNAARHIIELLRPHTREHGGPLTLQHLSFVDGRGNLIIEYQHPSATSRTDVVSFVGSHLDVVYANPANWQRDPFKLSIEGDELHGRGTTDCLGHCALQTDLFLQLAAKRPVLGGLRVVGVLIANEEAGGDGASDVGVEALQKHGHLDSLSTGPVIWLDCANKQPNIGSGGVVGWELTATGVMFHSGFPHKAINAIELATDALQEIQRDFYQAFPKHTRESEYGFECSSSMKPTRISSSEGSLNQIPATCTVQGDIRLIPFYKIREAVRVVEESVARLNSRPALHALEERVREFRGNDSKFVLKHGEQAAGHLKLRWLSEPIQGLACHLDSAGFRALASATKHVVGHVAPCADTGSLPLVADLQEAGFDVQTVGYGIEDAYHADNEYALLSDFQQGFRVLANIIDQLAPRAHA